MIELSAHPYKLEVRLNTLEMDACTNEWAAPGGQGLTTNPPAGVASLPDGSKGPQAGRVALYGRDMTTKGQWEERSIDRAGPGLEIKNLTLLEKVTSITVWLRHSGANSTGVGMDWIRLEDVTDSQ